eukprot:TRINITY_DN1059_c0_g1_i4.p1 TRINITY_DN1059_c0_g1~~TRINITY_DN1059_c0_g1_i4.p1  ORF type:complete len:643 (+),score=171.13 TRINITY_DN1059_c0_g1_i4:58-1986(+)
MEVAMDALKISALSAEVEDLDKDKAGAKKLDPPQSKSKSKSKSKSPKKEPLKDDDSDDEDDDDDSSDDDSTKSSSKDQKAKPKAVELPKRVAEREQRLSRSLIWAANSDFYQNCGISAFEQVPNYITSNCFIAKTYAQLICAYIRDCFQSSNLASDSYEQDGPILIVELGCGTGKFSYLLLKRLVDYSNTLPFFRNTQKRVKFLYVMTDFADKNIEYWRTNGYFKEFIDAGVLDFARFDARNDQQLNLILSKNSIEAATPKNPVVFIANYLFDSLENDAFQMVDGVLNETLLTILCDFEFSDTKKFLKKQVRTFTNKEIKPEAIESYYPDDPEIGNLLRKYYEQLLPHKNASFIIPLGGIGLIRNMMKLSNNRFLLLSSDKGYTHLKEFCTIEEPHVEYHGSLSCLANLHAIGMHIESHQGFCLSNPDQDNDFKTAAFVVFDQGNSQTTSDTIQPGSCSEMFNELRFVYKIGVEDFGPDHYFLLWKSVRTKDAFPSHVMALLRLSSHDPDLFHRFRHVLLEKVHTSPYRKDVLTELRRVWDNFYPNGPTDEDYVAFALGRIMFNVGDYTSAEYFFKESLKWDSKDHATYYNLGLCKERLLQPQLAIDNYNMCLAINPSFKRALERRERLKSQMSEQSKPVLE